MAPSGKLSDNYDFAIAFTIFSNAAIIFRSSDGTHEATAFKCLGFLGFMTFSLQNGRATNFQRLGSLSSSAKSRSNSAFNIASLVLL